MVRFLGPEDDELDYLEQLRQEGPSPEDYRNDNEIDWDTYEKVYDDWADRTGFPN
jgi:hypothetical protein